MTLTIGVDVGGTKIAAGVVDEDGTIIAQIRRPTPANDPHTLVTTIGEAARELAEVHDVSAVGIGAAGFINSERSKVIFAPNLAWRDEPLAERVHTAVGLPVIVENDANAAAWGEFRYGAAEAATSAVVVTVGTGIGGGIIINDQLLRGSHGFAGEIGHMNMVPDGLRCGCGEVGCWEMYSSGSALVRLAREYAKESPSVAVKLLDMAGGEPETINGPLVTRAAKAGDQVALDCFEQIGTWLGQGMADLAAVLDPDMFVIAGGVSEAGEILLRPAETTFRDRLTARNFRHEAPVVLATLANEAGMVGAADLARRL